MIFTKKILIKITLTSSIFILNLPGLAMKSDFQQPIQIYSVKQSLDFKKNITTFTENVVIKQGSIDVRADKIIITHPNGNVKKIIIEAYGTPATFYQLQDDGNQFKGHSDKICYEMEKELVTLTGNAYLEQSDSNIKSEKITYLVPTKQMKAFSDKGKQVTTILLPSKLQEKGREVKNINTGK
ncbi:MAG: lipopolysaccharide ABC transporter substrate-binding protein LptA [Arsenophonus sp.]